MPVAGVESLESPEQPRPGKSGLNMPVRSHILLVIVNQKIMPERGSEDRESDQTKSKANQACARRSPRSVVHRRGDATTSADQINRASCHDNRARWRLQAAPHTTKQAFFSCTLAGSG